jgi:hypothetical protein
VKVQDAHHRDRCRDLTGTERWACGDCDCSVKLERHLERQGKPFVELLREVSREDLSQR